MKIIIQICSLSTLLFFFSSCEEKSTNLPANNIEAKAGNDLDEHGCKPSAGYTWSILSRKCVQIWEEGVLVTPQFEHDKSLAFYAIEQEGEMELFIPSAGSELLKVSLDKTGTWENSKYLITSNGSELQLLKK